MNTTETVRALVDALEHMRKAANARGFDLMENSSPQKYWYGLRDEADSAIDAGNAVLAQAETAQPASAPVRMLTEDEVAEAVMCMGAMRPSEAVQVQFAIKNGLSFVAAKTLNLKD